MQTLWHNPNGSQSVFFSPGSGVACNGEYHRQMTIYEKMGIGLFPGRAGGHRLIAKDKPGGGAIVNYIVRSGDTLNSIASRFGVPVQELIRVNNIAYPYYIYVGQNIYIPVTTPESPASDVERRLRRVEDRVDALRSDFTKIEDRVDDLTTRVARLEARVTRLERSLPTPTTTPRPRPTITPRT